MDDRPNANRANLRDFERMRPCRLCDVMADVVVVLAVMAAAAWLGHGFFAR